MDNSFDFYNLIVFFTGFLLGNRLESALNKKRKIDELCVLFLNSIAVAIFAKLNQWSNVTNVFLTVFVVGCPFLWREKKFILL